MITSLLFAFILPTSHADSCPNNVDRNAYRVRLTVDPDGVDFKVDSATDLIVKMKSPYDYAKHYFFGVCYISTEADVQKNRAGAREGLSQPPQEVVRAVSPTAFWYNNPYTLFKSKPVIEKKVVQVSDTEEQTQTRITNPALQEQLNDCRAKQEAARTAKVRLVITPGVQPLGLPICELAQ